MRTRADGRPELDFFLLERDEEAPGGLRRYVDELSRVYTVGPISDPRGIVLQMLLACEQLGLGAFAANHEFMNSQYEINVDHSEALDAADRAFLLKAIGWSAEPRGAGGMVATFGGQAVQRPGRIGLPRPPLAEAGRRRMPFDAADFARRSLGLLRAPVRRRECSSDGQALMALLVATPTSVLCPTASRRPTSTGVSTIARPSCGSRTSTARAAGSRCVPETPAPALTS